MSEGTESEGCSILPVDCHVPCASQYQTPSGWGKGHGGEYATTNGGEGGGVGGNEQDHDGEVGAAGPEPLGAPQDGLEEQNADWKKAVQPQEDPSPDATLANDMEKLHVFSEPSESWMSGFE